MLDLELLGESNWRGPGSGRQVPFYKRTWFRALVALTILGFVSAFGVLVFVIQPMREKAATYDLSECKKLEAASVIFDRYGGEIGRIYVMNRTPVKLSEVPSHLRKALISQEDSRFPTHDGVDYLGIARAIWLTVKVGRVTQGASTLTQQLARNTFELREKSIQRKLLEAFVAQQIEKHYTKDEIMELYLNRIFFGSGNGQQFYGIQAAARGYFGKDVDKLNIEESATIVGLIKSPNNFSPLRRPQASIKSRNMVFHRMAEEGYISPEDEEQLSKKPMITATQVVDSRLTFVYDEVSRQVKKIFGEERAATGGFNIYTSIDPVIQTKAEESVHRRLTEVENYRRSLAATDKTAAPYPHQTYVEYGNVITDFRNKMRNREIDPATPKPTAQYLQGAAVVLDNHDGSILAVVGGRDYTHSQLNRALQSPRSPGMAFLPMVYATAFTQPTFFPGTPFEDAPFNNTKVMFGATGGTTGEWGIEADTHTFTMKPIAARQGLVHSLNSITMRLAYEAFPGATDQTVNLSPLREQVQRMGIDSPLPDNPRNVLGDSPAKLTEIALAYTCFPNGGSRAKAVHLVNKITDAQDKIIYQVDDEVTTPVEALDPIAAYQVNTCLVDSMDHGTASAAHTEFGLKKFPVAGKTGTHYGFKDLWFAGYDSAVTCAVWVGFDTPKAIFDGAYSSRIAMPIWCDIMNSSLQNHKPEPFKTPGGMEKMELCRRSGQRATDFCYEKRRDKDGRERSVRDTYFELVRPGTIFAEPCTVHEGEGLALDLLAFQSNIGKPASSMTVRGAAPVQFANVDAVRMKEATLQGEDPYNTLKPTVQYDETKEGGVAKRAERVSDEDEAPTELPIKLPMPSPQPLKLEP